MRIAVYILIAVCVALMVMCYSLLVMVIREEERAERMYREWKESNDGRFDKTE
jgi:hypothetical protein